ncbi:MAG TPA: aconitate hydratase AcnA [Anaerolineales bacterium]|nr:aconitate hydratase AcnA [Anaerolineales bacterium]
MTKGPFGAQSTLEAKAGRFTIYRLEALEQAGLVDLGRMPYSIRILLEAVLRQADGGLATERDVRALAGWLPRLSIAGATTDSSHASQSGRATRSDIPFHPARVIMQDFTGVPAVVDLAAMRSALARFGGDPKKINPHVAVDLVIDHSIQVDFFATPEALQRNTELELQRNRERYEFLRWGAQAFDRFRVVPPATGIVHQVNLEYLAQVVLTRAAGEQVLAFPDTLVGTDSHTTMINALGVLGWGVGGIEAEAALLGQPLVMVAPDVVGVRLTGRLPEGSTATDLVLRVTQMLRQHGVVGKFVEFCGPGVAELSLPDRATVANMAPEYGATVGFFPVDEETLHYLHLTGRDEALIDLVERYCKEQGLFRSGESPEPEFSELLEVDLGGIEASVAGPKRPQDRVPLSGLKSALQRALTAATSEGGFGLDAQSASRKAQLRTNGATEELAHGAVVIAAITSCTNTSNPSVMLAAGLLARKAVARGMHVKPYVKTSLAPGSRVVTDYLRQSGLSEPLAQLGFNVVGYGCTTCIGNSGPLPGDVVKAITESELVAAAVLSGNRNFEGRINPHVRASFLTSPPLVVAFALAGTTDIDLTHEPLGADAEGNPVYLREIWPTEKEVIELATRTLSRDVFRQRYADVFLGNPSWNSIPISGGDLYPWDPSSTYVQEPPFFADMPREPRPVRNIHGARVLALLGDSVTTDHISPAGAIPAESPAGRYLIGLGIQPRDFNSYGARRGNDRVMTRGTFANIRLKNLLVPGVEGGVTVHFPDGARMSVFEAALKYREEGVPLVVIAGKEYGAGSSRDWAAKGAALLGVRAVIAESFERIHRSNLVGMGILPLQFLPGEGVAPLGLTGHELLSVLGLEDGLAPDGRVSIIAQGEHGGQLEFAVRVRIDTPTEVEYYRHGGVLQMVLRQILGAGAPDSNP